MKEQEPDNTTRSIEKFLKKNGFSPTPDNISRVKYYWDINFPESLLLKKLSKNKNKT